MRKPRAGQVSLALAVFLAELTGAPVLEPSRGEQPKKRLSEQRGKADPPAAGTAGLSTTRSPATTGRAMPAAEVESAGGDVAGVTAEAEGAEGATRRSRMPRTPEPSR
jgi:hypothetical protein